MGKSRQRKKEFSRPAHELLNGIQDIKVVKKLNIIKDIIKKQKREKTNKEFKRKQTQEEDP